VYDGSNVIGELDAQGNLITAYTHGVGGLVSLRRAAGPRYYHFDGLGSTTELTDATQAVTDSYRYEAFGNLTAQVGNTRNAYRYVGSLGYYADADSGLMLLGARYYGSAVGRFITVDPVREGGNWYGYVGSNPINWKDPLGLQEIDCGLLKQDCLTAVNRSFEACKRAAEDWKRDAQLAAILIGGGIAAYCANHADDDICKYGGALAGGLGTWYIEQEYTKRIKACEDTKKQGEDYCENQFRFCRETGLPFPITWIPLPPFVIPIPPPQDLIDYWPNLFPPILPPNTKGG